MGHCECGGIEKTLATIFALPQLPSWGQMLSECVNVQRHSFGNIMAATSADAPKTKLDHRAAIHAVLDAPVYAELNQRGAQFLHAFTAACWPLGELLKHDHVGLVSV